MTRHQPALIGVRGSAGSDNRTRHGQPARPAIRRLLTVTGTVQGVGFRPFVWRLATGLHLAGMVRNTSAGVEIEVEGPPRHVLEFIRRLRAEAPPAAVVHGMDAHVLPLRGGTAFAVQASRDAGQARTHLPADITTCADCVREIFDPRARRYRYPFTNCTRCGPRFTVVTALPYDRTATTLRGFPLCVDCAREYADPADRRFHAEPIACPRCGPRLWLEGGGGPSAADAIAAAARLLQGGAVLVVHGLGGMHLTCDAGNDAAVSRLRAIKQRPHKPLAVMVASLADAERLAFVTPAARALLAAPAAPIVLLARRPEADLAAAIAPGTDQIGLMLAYSPLHHLLLRDARRPLVMTSANRPGEPIACTAEEARAQFAHRVDALLLHDRPIEQRCDDSVWMVTAAGPQPLRRSRGSVPERIAVPLRPAAPVLGVGGDQKNTFCLLDRHGALLSQHIGALSYAATQAHFRASLAHLQRLSGVVPALVAHDLHPGYASRALAEGLGAPCVGVQHHHAHVAACLAEHGRGGPAIGLAFDGTGYGSDGAIWGAEVLIADLAGFRRIGQFEYLPLPGGDAAIRHPARVAAAYLLALFGDVADARLRAALGETTLATLRRMIERRINTVPTSSCGRLFDAVAALLGIADTVTYEGQAAVMLEALARGDADETEYPFTIADGVVRLAPILAAILADRASAVPVARVARRLHRTLAAVVHAQARRARAQTGLDSVALTGGCFQNRLLLADCCERLSADGFTVLVHRQVSANDGGLALGQAVVAAAQQKEQRRCV
jgi:hydrogenase maturation protein HypF